MEKILIETKEEMKSGNMRSSQNFEQLFNSQLSEGQPHGDEKEELLRDILAERREKRIHRKPERSTDFSGHCCLSTASLTTGARGTEKLENEIKNNSVELEEK